MHLHLKLRQLSRLSKATPLRPGLHLPNKATCHRVGLHQASLAAKTVPKKIDPASMPTPVALTSWTGEPQLYLTRPDPPTAAGSRDKASEALVPHPLSQFWVIDNGNASLRFMRPTMRSVPISLPLLKQTGIPFAIVLKPLGLPGPSEELVPVVDPTSRSSIAEGPLRCLRCKAYANCWDQFLNSGRQYACGLCGHKNEMPADQYVPVDATGRLIDPASRPEYTRGSVSWAVGGPYVLKAKGPLSFVAVLDVSSSAVASGVLPAFLRALQYLLETLPADSPVHFGLITFDETVHFWDLSSRNAAPRMLVVSELEDMYLPLSPADRLIVRVADSLPQLRALIELLPLIFSTSKSGHSCFGAATTAARVMLMRTGGKILAIPAALPNFGPGALQARARPTGPNASERKLFAPQVPFYGQLAEACANAAIGVELFALAATATTPMDFPTLLPLAEMTGGSSHYYVASEPRSLESFSHDIIHSLTRPTSYDCIMRLRTSLGLDITEYLGSAYHTPGDSFRDLIVPICDSDKTFVVGLKYETKLEADTPTVFQCATLHTNREGRRLVTVHTLGLYSTTALHKVFRSADISAVSFVNAFTCAARLKTEEAKHITDGLTEKCVDLLHNYRVNCSQNQKQRQLILPESLKLLPIYSLATIRSSMFRVSPGRAIDERAFLRSLLHGGSIETVLSLLYPRLVPLHSLPPTLAIPDESGYVISLPQLLPLRSASIEDQGFYLLDNGLAIYMYIGKNINADVFHSAIAASPATPPTYSLQPKGVCDLADRIHAIIATLSLASPTRFKPLHILTPCPQTENHKNIWMIEERLNEVSSYVDYLCNVHRLIQSRS